MANVIVIGSGKVGQELGRQLEAKQHTVLATATSKLVSWRGNQTPIRKVGDPGEICKALAPIIPDADAAMLAIPNGDKGAAEMHYLRAFNDKHKITCAKAANAYRYGEVLKLGTPVGRRATVGGGSDLLEVLRRRQIQDEKVLVYAVINGTANDIWSTIQRGGSFPAAIEQAKLMQYAEPGDHDPIDIVHGELVDMTMKGAITYNVALTKGGPYLSAADFKIFPLKRKDIMRLTSRNARYRYIVTFASVSDYDRIPKGTPGSIHARCGRWTIRGGFHDVKAESPWFDWLRQMDGVNNGFTIHNAFGQDTGNSLSGPGAGPEVTAKAMVRDLEDLLAA